MIAVLYTEGVCVVCVCVLILQVSIDICTDLSVLTAAIGSQPHPSCVVAVPDPRLQ